VAVHFLPIGESPRKMCKTSTLQLMGAVKNGWLQVVVHPCFS